MKVGSKTVRTGLVLAGCCALLCLVRSMQGRVVTQGPVDATVFLEKTEHDFGVVGSTPVRASFTVRNFGSRRLVINEDACASCGLTVSALPVVIDTGGRAEIVVELQTRSIHGSVRREAAYTTNDPTMPRFSLVLHAQRPPHDK